MLRASPALSVGQASHYYKSEFSRGDYYTERESEGIVASRWHGRGARELGLSGRVRADEFARLLEGRNPSGRNLLVARREGKDERRAGWDVTISPHKSVSLQALVGGDSRLLDAHDKAVSMAVAELERHVQAWVHGGRGVETTGHVIGASFRHETSRALDPQLHSHCVLLNITRRSDGEWRAVDARGLFRAQRLAREIYEAELGKELRALGYQVKSYKDGRHGRDRAVGIAGFEPGHLKHFSKRSREIDEALQAGGLKSRLHGSRVTLATRAAKPKGIDREALLWNWRTTAREMKLEFPRWEPQLPDRSWLAGYKLQSRARDAVDGAVAHLSERRSVFRLADLEREALSRGRDQDVTIEDLRREIAGRPELVVVDPQDAVVARVTTTRAIQEERALLTAVERGRGQGALIPSMADGRGLGEDQLRVARHVLESPDRLVAVEGKAGTGKSTTLAHVRERAEAAGFKVRGFAPTTTAAGVLSQGGFDATTVAALLQEAPSPKRKKPELWVVDEAGLLSTRQAGELLDRAESADVKLVLVGDRAQHRAVEAGSPFELLIERGKVATERLDVIRRQRDEQLRGVVLAASEPGGTALAVRLLEERGRVVEIPDRRQRHEAITRDFIADGGRGVVIAPSNAERQDLNHRIREALIEAAQVEKKSVKAKVVVKQNLTAEQKGRAGSFREGDVLRFVRGGGGIEAGDRASVVSIDEERNRLRLRLERSGHPCQINPKERRAFEVERVVEKRFAVGDRIQFRARDRSLDVANGTLGTIKKLDHARGVATVDVGGRRFRMDLSEPRAVDHAYAVTSHKSQGLARERVYLAVDTAHSEELVNRRQFYVGISRAVEDARVYTDDRAALVRAVSRDQGREGALQLGDRVPVWSRTVALKRETPLDLVRSSDDERRGREDGRAVGGDRRSTDADRGAHAPRRGAEGPAGAARRASGPERGGAQGADRVPGQGDAGASRAGRAAAHGRGRGDQGLAPTRPLQPGFGRSEREASEGDSASRSAPGGPAPGVDGRRIPGGDGRDVPREPGRDHAGRGQTASERAGSKGTTAPGERHPALTRKEIEKSPGLARRYALEYREALRLVPDRDLAKDVARVNLTARERGEPPLVTREVVRRLGPRGLGQAITRDGRDLLLLRGALGVVRVLSRAIEHGIGRER